MWLGVVVPAGVSSGGRWSRGRAVAVLSWLAAAVVLVPRGAAAQCPASTPYVCPAGDFTLDDGVVGTVPPEAPAARGTGTDSAASSIAPPAEDDGIPVAEGCDATEPGTASSAPGMAASLSALALVIATASRMRRRLQERRRAVSFRSSAPA